MLIAPTLIAAVTVGATPAHAALLIAWLSAYCFNFYFALGIKTRRRADHWQAVRAQLLIYGGIAAFGAAFVATAAPVSLWLAPGLAIGAAANLTFVIRKDERSWLNDVIGIVLAMSVGWLAYQLGDGAESTEVWHSLLAQSLYFLGTVWHVKSLIRERNSPRWRTGSIVWHTLAVLVALVFINVWVGLTFGLALIRAIKTAAWRLSVKQIGLVEVGLTVLLAVQLTLL